MMWGVEENVIERFGAADIPEDKISFEKATYTFNHPGPPAELLAEFRTYYGPTMNAFEAAAASGREAELQPSWTSLFTEQNETGNEAPTSIPATYLRVTVSVSGGVCGVRWRETRTRPERSGSGSPELSKAARPRYPPPRLCLVERRLRRPRL